MSKFLLAKELVAADLELGEKGPLKYSECTAHKARSTREGEYFLFFF